MSAKRSKGPTSTETVAGQWASAATPPPALTVSQWADAERMLPETSSARGAKWRTDTTPYLRGIMDSVHELGVKKIAIRKSAQVGGSEALHNILGYFIEHDPCPMLFVQPTATVASEWSKERLSDMIRSTPALRKAVREKRIQRGSLDPESTLGLKLFPGGFLALGGANTPNTFARRSVRIAIGDDVDRFPAVVGEEGDPAELLTARTKTFQDGLVILVSTPTLKGGRIDTAFERSDQRQFFVTCPACGREDYITWNDPKHFRVSFDERDATTARIECPSREERGCGAHIDEPTRRQLVVAAAAASDGGWRPTVDVAKEVGLIGFHLPAMITTLGSASLSEWVSDWLSAREKGKESLRVFINTTLGEGWQDRSARLDAHTLLNRREDYGRRAETSEQVEVPAAAVALTAGVDVQKNRIEILVEAWGVAEERWLVDVDVVPGNAKQQETRDALLAKLGRTYRHACGLDIPVHSIAVDCGYATEEMYDFVLAHQARRIFAVKGVGGRAGQPIVGKPSEQRYGRNPRPVRLYTINTDDAKRNVMNSLTLPGAGPGYFHVPMHLENVNEEFFAQMCAEHVETRRNRAGVATHEVWVQDRDRNEVLDMRVYSLAAYRLLNPNIRQMLEALGAAVKAKEASDAAAASAPQKRAPTSPPPAPAPARQPRTGPINYLRR